MIEEINFKNYKIFKKKQNLSLCPITIIIGKNNTGKSAVLKLPMIIEDSLKTQNNEPISRTGGELVIVNEYKDLVYGKFSRALELELYQSNELEDNQDSLIAHIAIDSSNDKPILEYWKLNEEIELERKSNIVYTNLMDETDYSCSFNGIYLGLYFYEESPDVSGTVFSQPFHMNTDFIGGERQKVKRYYEYQDDNFKKSGLDGRNLYNFLIKDYLTTDKKYFNQISNWIRDKFEGWELYIDIDNEPYHIELRKGNLEINITDTGMGIGQSLPLIMRAFKPCEEETLIIIEEPESNLHPYAHAELAQLFADSLTIDSNKQYLIETHSLNFVLRMRRLVAQGELDKDDLAIYYVDFDEENNESNIKRIKVDEGGGVEWWPDGVFSETTKETRAIYNAQVNDLRNVDRD